MALDQIKQFIESKEWPYRYTDVAELGSIDFEYLGVSYHVWEFMDDQYGVESNVKNIGKLEEFLGDYENDLIEIMKKWGE
ncbi:kinase [Acetobacterium paludosum]|uniref:Kinase n=1 Tax=Acetobacterium paludosum TaxID=52693 RepID=A0A923HRK4_9FIRM|nr:kinase [Acetobacterium paludosum]MBC3887086.1 kinase [Acetobacterium paludosum]